MGGKRTGEAEMRDKKQILEILMLLSALESWSFSMRQTLPDYLHERLTDIVTDLSKQVLDGKPEPK